MIIKMTPSAREMLSSSIKGTDEKLFRLKMVKYDCNGPVLAISIGKSDEAETIIEVDGFRFGMDREESRLFDEISIDYIEEGISEGFSITSKSNSLGKCYIGETVE